MSKNVEIIVMVTYPREQIIEFRDSLELARWAAMNRDWDIRWHEVDPDDLAPPVHG